MFRVLFLTLLLCPILMAQVSISVPGADLRDQSSSEGQITATVELEGITFFLWDDGIHGQELWRSDGTAEGTFKLTDALPEDATLSRYQLAAINGKVNFSGSDGDGGLFIYESDGTLEGTTRIYDGTEVFGFNFGTHLILTNGPYEPVISVNRETLEETQLSARGDYVRVLGNVLTWYDSSVRKNYASDGVNTWEIGGSSPSSRVQDGWLIFDYTSVAVSDGTPDSYTEIFNTRSNSITASNGKIYFIAYSQEEGRRILYVSDGTAEGTSAMDTGYPWAGLYFFGNLSAGFDGIYFIQNSRNYYTNGTPEGTHEISLPSGSVSYLGRDGNTFYLQHRIDGEPYTVYRLDGQNYTAIYENDQSVLGPNRIGAESLLFQAYEDETKWGLRSLNVSSHTVTDILVNPGRDIARVEINAGPILGNGDGKVVLLQPDGSLRQLAARFDENIGLASTGDLAYFAVDGQLWQTDGTLAGTVNLQLPVTVIRGVPGQLITWSGADVMFKGVVNRDYAPLESAPRSWQLDLTLFVYGDRLYWRESTSNGFFYDMTTGGEVNYVSFARGNHKPEYLINGKLISGDLWVWDLLGHQFREFQGSPDGAFAATTDRVYYNTIEYPGPVRKVWESDGTIETLLWEMQENQPGLEGNLYPLNGSLLFLANDETSGTELYRLDGGAPVLVKDLTPGAGSSDIRELTTHNGLLYFTFYDPTSGRELWRTDGTEVGTIRVTDFNPGSGTSAPEDLWSTDLGLLFSAYDGSDTGLYMVRALNNGLTHSDSLCRGGSGEATALETLPGTTYNWSITGGTILSGAGTSSIRFEAGAGASVDLEVTLSNGNDSVVVNRVIPIVDAAPDQPASITGETTACSLAEGLTFSVPAVATADAYEWQVPAGATIIGDATGDAIVVNLGSEGGDIRVRSRNACGESPWQSLTLVLEGAEPAYAGADWVSCETDVVLAANLPAGSTGQWTILEGAGGSFADGTQPGTTFSGVAGTAYVLEWRLTHAECGESADTVRIAIETAVPTATAGDDISTCAASVSLGANLPDGVVGVWGVTSGTGGSFDNPLDPNTTFHGEAGQTYTLAWTLYAKPCGESSDSLIVDMSSDAAANAGPDGRVAHNDSLALCGNGMGSWSVASGPSLAASQFADVNDPFTRFSPGGGPGSYVLEWTITDQDCGTTSDTMTLEALAWVPEPVLVDRFGTKEPGDGLNVQLYEAEVIDSKFYFIGAGEPKGLYVEEDGEARLLGDLSLENTTDFAIHALGEDVLVYGEGTYFYDQSKRAFTRVYSATRMDGSALVIFNGLAYFEKQGETGTDIWQTNGHESGTRLAIANAKLLGVYEQQLLFAAQGQIFKGNGTGAGSVSITPGENYDSLRYLGHLGETLIIHVKERDNFYRVLAYDLTDGSETELLTTNQDDAFAFASHNGGLLFSIGMSGVVHDDWLYYTDGTRSGTAYANIEVTPAREMIVYEGHLYFQGYDSLWRMDGSFQSLEVLSENTLLRGRFITSFGYLFYSTSNGYTTRVEPSGVSQTMDLDLEVWAANDTHFLVYEINPYLIGITNVLAPRRADALLESNSSLEIRDDELHMLTGGLLFRYRNIFHPSQGFWSFDGTPGGLTDLVVPGQDVALLTLRVSGGHAAFMSQENGMRYLWVTDGTLAGTTLLASGSSLDDDFHFAPLGSAYLVGSRGDGLTHYEGGVATEITADEVRGPFKDPYTDAAFYIRADGAIMRATGGPDTHTVQNYLATTNFRFNGMIGFTEDSVYVYRESEVVLMDRFDRGLQFLNLPSVPTIYWRDRFGFTGTHFLCYDLYTGVESLGLDGSVLQANIRGDLSDFVKLGDKIAFASRTTIYVTDGATFDTYPLAGDYTEPPRLESVGVGLIYWGLTYDRGYEGFYFDEQGERPLPEFVEGPGSLTFQGIATDQGRAYIMLGDSEYRSALYRLDVGGPAIGDANLYAYLLSLYDINGDGHLDWDEAAAIEVIDLRPNAEPALRSDSWSRGVRSLEGIEQLENLSELYLEGNSVTDLGPIIASGLGNDPDDVIDLEYSDIGEDPCGSLNALAERVASSGGTLLFGRQGGVISDLEPETWPQRSILNFLSENFSPVYDLDCGEALKSLVTAGGEVQ